MEFFDFAESPLLEERKFKELKTAAPPPAPSNFEKQYQCTDEEIYLSDLNQKNYLEIPTAPSQANNQKSHKMTEKVEDVIGKITGQFGKWQLRTVLLIFLVKIPSSWFMACIIFTAPAPRHGEFYCKPPSDVIIGNKTDWVKISHPAKEEKEDQEFKIDFCNVYSDALEHAEQLFNKTHLLYRPWEMPTRNSNIIPCESFEHHAHYTSLITQFDLVCSRDILVAVTQFFHLFGVLVGGCLAVKLLDHFSPRNVMLFGMLSQIICGNLTGLVSHFQLHNLFRCLSAVCCAQMYTAGSMIFSDITSGKPRTIITTCFEQFWSVGVILLPGVASFLGSWSHIYMAISMPTFTLVFLLQWIPDSPRWLLKRGKIAEVKAILIKSAKINNKLHLIPRDLEEQLKLQAAAVAAEPAPPGFFKMWRGPGVVKNLICVHLVWSIYIVIYYGMLLNIRTFGRDWLEVNTVIAGLSEIIGTFIGLALILKTTRKWLWTGLFNILAAFIAFTIWYIPSTVTGGQRVVLEMASSMVSKIAISSTLGILTTSTTEMVVPEKKKMCGYSTIVWARIWLLTAPFVGVTAIFGKYVPQTAFAFLAIIGGLFTCLINTPRTLPKTKKITNLPSELDASEIWTIKNDKNNIIPY